ncbi:MAG: 3 terminal ribose 2-O-methyltransferase Hen1 [Chlamydiales bacterium]|jgi:3' terminal RNA ribose 2'-O-methyltransferase Hen1|nr:3 terminal ribose 2-O-methyltransferase Hen1 [Chlamydiales bacterium]
MTFTITTHYHPATDLGYLLHKHPEKLHQKKFAFGTAYLFYTKAAEDLCSVTLLLDIDPLELSKWNRKSGFSAQPELELYVNDRPYTANSFLSVVMKKMFSTAMSGHCDTKSDLVQQKLPLSVTIPVIACNGREKVIKSLFEPLGYQAKITHLPLDSQFTSWENSSYYRLDLEVTTTVCDLLNQLYIFIPILDNSKHYWIDLPEVDKLLEKGGSWLNSHPHRELIVTRYLKYRKLLVQKALSLINQEEFIDQGVENLPVEEILEHKLSLHEIRLTTVKKVLLEKGARKILDLGCGEGRLVELLLKEAQIEEILGVDVSYRALQIAQQRLKLDELTHHLRQKINLHQSSLAYYDKKLKGFDAAAVVEVIEHLEPFQLATFSKILFQYIQPRLVVITTPNKEYNTLFNSLTAGAFRHPDHRFEWTRKEFQNWAQAITTNYPYQVEFHPLGDLHEVYGSPSQMAIFQLEAKKSL